MKQTLNEIEGQRPIVGDINELYRLHPDWCEKYIGVMLCCALGFLDAKIEKLDQFNSADLCIELCEDKMINVQVTQYREEGRRETSSLEEQLQQIPLGWIDGTEKISNIICRKEEKLYSDADNITLVVYQNARDFHSVDVDYEKLTTDHTNSKFQRIYIVDSENAMLIKGDQL